MFVVAIVLVGLRVCWRLFVGFDVGTLGTGVSG